jgi:antirestriction protein ArdC
MRLFPLAKKQLGLLRFFKGINHMKDTKNKADIYQTITDQIVAAIEAGAPDFKMPWHRQSCSSLPINIQTNNAYRGINILALWVAQMRNQYSTNLWGTYKQWKDRGAQVRKGEKASLVVFYMQIERKTEDSNTKETKPTKALIAKASFVFNAEQVDGFTSPIHEQLEDLTKTLDSVSEFIKSTGAIIIHGGQQAYYRPRLDVIHMPRRTLFIGTNTSTPTKSYYSTLCHELTHWTSHENRLNRQLGERFGDEAYAIEELIAELGAAFLCARLGISASPRLDHAAYLNSWLKVLKDDKKAIFTAASKASQAVDFLYGLQTDIRGEAA